MAEVTADKVHVKLRRSTAGNPVAFVTDSHRDIAVMGGGTSYAAALTEACNRLRHLQQMHDRQADGVVLHGAP